MLGSRDHIRRIGAEKELYMFMLYTIFRLMF